MASKLSSYEIPDYPLYKMALATVLFVSAHANAIPAG